MGIPAYFRNIIRDYPSIISPIAYGEIHIDYLLLGKPIYLINNPDPDPQRELSSVLKNINLPNIDNKKSLQDMIEKLKLDELKSDNIQNLKNVIYENQDHLKTIDRINKIFLSS